ncbi:MAG: molybdopterin-dependent oxidoreductase [Actinomycetota bacterium]
MEVPASAEPAERSSGRDLWLAGLLASAVSLSALWTVSALVDGIPFPPIVLADAIVRATPGGPATFFIELLGHWALRLLSAGVVVGAIALGGLTLVRARRAGPAAALLGVIAVAASYAAPSTDRAALPTLLAVSASAALFWWTSRATLRAMAEAGPGADEGRRRMLRIGMGSAVGLAVGGAALGWVARKLGGPNTDVPLLALDEPATIPARDEDFPDIDGLSPEITSADDHYVVDINLFKPSVEAEGWTLEVKGLVDRRATYDFESLQRSFELVEQYSVLCCISNEVGGPLIGHSAWGGVRLADVLDAAGVSENAFDVVFRAADGYSDSIPIEVATRDDVLVAISQNGEPLTQDHGFPCRIRVPAIYGMKNVKWLESIEVVPRDYLGYWMRRGWSDEAIVKTQSRIDVAGRDRSARRGEPTWIAGIAWAGTRGISKVEVSTDGGDTWDDAMLREPIAPASWTLWAHRWTPDRTGDAVIVVRATDGEGTLQTARPADPHPAGATGYHSVTVRIT